MFCHLPSVALAFLTAFYMQKLRRCLRAVSPHVAVVAKMFEQLGQKSMQTTPKGGRFS